VPRAADQTGPGVSPAGGGRRQAPFDELLARLAGKRPSRSPDEATEAAAPKREPTAEDPACFDAASILGPAVAVTTPVVRLADSTGETAEDAGDVNDGPGPRDTRQRASRRAVRPRAPRCSCRRGDSRHRAQPTAETGALAPPGIDNDSLREPEPGPPETMTLADGTRAVPYTRDRRGGPAGRADRPRFLLPHGIRCAPWPPSSPPS